MTRLPKEPTDLVTVELIERRYVETMREIDLHAEREKARQPVHILTMGGEWVQVSGT